MLSAMASDLDSRMSDILRKCGGVAVVIRSVGCRDHLVVWIGRPGLEPKSKEEYTVAAQNKHQETIWVVGTSARGQRLRPQRHQ